MKKLIFIPGVLLAGGMFAAAILLSGCAVKKNTAATTNGITVEKIWDQAPHNAFTDILRFNNAFYCTFREGSGHVSGPDGKARILRSTDGKNGKAWPCSK